MDTPQVLLEHDLKQLRLPTILRESQSWPNNAPKRARLSRYFCCGWWNRKW